VLGITSGAADFLGPSGIRVCSVSPAIVASALMGPDRIPYFESELEAGVIFPRRTSQPEEVAHAILFLIENGMMNDFHMKVDGGWRGSSNWGGPKDRGYYLVHSDDKLIKRSEVKCAISGVKRSFVPACMQGMITKQNRATCLPLINLLRSSAPMG
jgi:hypothetical protein